LLRSGGGLSNNIRSLFPGVFIVAFLSAGLFKLHDSSGIEVGEASSAPTIHALDSNRKPAPAPQTRPAPPTGTLDAAPQDSVATVINVDLLLAMSDISYSHDHDQREQAVYTLLELDGEDALPGIEQALLDPVLAVRGAAIDALEEIGGELAFEALVFALGDPSEELREDALLALQAIAGDVALDYADPGIRCSC